MKARILMSLLLGLVLMLGFSGCETPGQSAMAGAAAGAFLGGSIKGSGRDMARGAALGAAGGYVLGKVSEADRNRATSRAVYGGGSVGAYPGDPHHPVRIPWGRSSGRYGFVYSPYSNRLIDVRRIPHGAEVVDPFTGHIFLNP
jgi:osmotically inducible lipoprotein OsmB